jgi:hypothetical protein
MISMIWRVKTSVHLILMVIDVSDRTDRPKDIDGDEVSDPELLFVT